MNYYIISIVFAFILIIIDLITNQKKRKKLKLYNLPSKLDNISKNKVISFMLRKRESKQYIKIKKNLKQSGLNLSPEAFQVITLVIPILLIIIAVIMSYINKLNMLINIDKIIVVAEQLGKPELAEISFKLNKPIIVISALIGYFIPYGLLKIIILIRRAVSEREVLILQTYTIIMLKAEMPTKRILVSLYKRTKLFKKELETAVNNFSTNPNRTLRDLKENSFNDGFKKIIISLEQNLNNDKKIGLIYLQNNRTLGKDIAEQIRKRRTNKKNIIGILFMIVPLIALLAIGFYPWLVYALKQIGSISY